MYRRRIKRAQAGGSDLRSLKAGRSNSLGRQHEAAIEGACRYYRDTGRANIIKVPEPFRVEHKTSPTTAYVRFIAHAQPDFFGTLGNGQTIVFEAKATETDQLRQAVVTPTQAATLENFHRMGAVAGVCASIGRFGDCYFIPWAAWRDMKEKFGHKYVTREDIEYYRIRFNGCAMFLDYQSRDRLTTGSADTELHD